MLTAVEPNEIILPENHLTLHWGYSAGEHSEILFPQTPGLSNVCLALKNSALIPNMHI